MKNITLRDGDHERCEKGFFWAILYDIFNPTRNDQLSQLFFNSLANSVYMELVVP